MREPLPRAEVDGESSLPDPLTEAIRRADLAALWRAVEELPRRQRHALLLREFGGLSYEELAQALGVSRPTVESLLFRARHALRDRLRAAYAAVSGASWLDAFGRLLAGGSGGAAPAAAKAVALGVGAAVVTGGAAVGPTIVHHRAHGVATAARQARVETVKPSHGSAPQARSPRTVVPSVRSDRGPRRRRGRGDAVTTTSAAHPADDGTGDRQDRSTGSAPSAGPVTQSSDGGRSSPSSGDSSGSGDSRQSGDGSRVSGDGALSSGDDGGSAGPTTQVTTSSSGESGSSGDGSSISGSDSSATSSSGMDGGSSGSGDTGSSSGGSGDISSGGSIDGGSGGTTDDGGS